MWSPRRSAWRCCRRPQQRRRRRSSFVTKRTPRPPSRRAVSRRWPTSCAGLCTTTWIGTACAVGPTSSPSSRGSFRRSCCSTSSACPRRTSRRSRKAPGIGCASCSAGPVTTSKWPSPRAWPASGATARSSPTTGEGSRVTTSRPTSCTRLTRPVNRSPSRRWRRSCSVCSSPGTRRRRTCSATACAGSSSSAIAGSSCAQSRRSSPTPSRRCCASTHR